MVFLAASDSVEAPESSPVAASLDQPCQPRAVCDEVGACHASHRTHHVKFKQAVNAGARL